MKSNEIIPFILLGIIILLLPSGDPSDIFTIQIWNAIGAKTALILALGAYIAYEEIKHR